MEKTIRIIIGVLVILIIILGSFMYMTGPVDKNNTDNTININGYNVFLTHGHKYNMDRLPPLGIKMDIMMYGHFHEGFIIEENGIIFANPG